MRMTKLILILVWLSIVLGAANASEWPYSLEHKVSESDLVVLGTVTSVVLGEIQKEESRKSKTQAVKLEVNIDDVIYGRAGKNITIHCYSSSYSEKIENGIRRVTSTAGFSSHGITKGTTYIAYLKQKDGKYYLAFSSNQSLEKIDPKKNIANDVGQTTATVPLNRKLDALRKIATNKMNKR